MIEMQRMQQDRREKPKRSHTWQDHDDGTFFAVIIQHDIGNAISLEAPHKRTSYWSKLGDDRFV